MTVNLGTLEKVRIRDVWPGEAREFTPWLAEEANLEILGSAVGIDLECESTEVAVGSYRLDILARVSGTGEAVVIENQFGATDHKHLGQVLTYAAGVSNDGSTGARAVIWIAEDFCEPHRSALDWLNNISETGVGFFGVQIELWRIGQSLPAPRFTIISKPNGWQKAVTQQSLSAQANEPYLSFWEAFSNLCRSSGSPLRLPNAWGRHWLPMPIGRSNFQVSLVLTRRAVRCELYMSGNRAKKAFHLLSAEEAKIREDLGEAVQFDELRNKLASRICETKVVEIGDRSQWPDIQQWMKERAEAFQKTFVGRVRNLDLDDEEDDTVS